MEQLWESLDHFHIIVPSLFVFASNSTKIQSPACKRGPPYMAEFVELDANRKMHITYDLT